MLSARPQLLRPAEVLLDPAARSAIPPLSLTVYTFRLTYTPLTTTEKFYYRGKCLAGSGSFRKRVESDHCPRRTSDQLAD